MFPWKLGKHALPWSIQQNFCFEEMSFFFVVFNWRGMNLQHELNQGFNVFCMMESGICMRGGGGGILPLPPQHYSCHENINLS